MGIIGSLPLKWASVAGGGVDTSPLDISNTRPHSEHSEHLSRNPPSMPLAVNHSSASNSTGSTLIGSSPSKSDGSSTGSSHICNIVPRSERSKHTCAIQQPVESGVKLSGRKRSIESTTSAVSSLTKRRRVVEREAIPRTKQPSTFAPFASTSKTSSTDTTNVDRPPEIVKAHNPASQLANLNTKQCLITNKDISEAPIKPCYLLNQRLWANRELLTRLEWGWGMKYDSLELETQANRIHLQLDWLKSFDSNRWVLLPSPGMVNKLWDHCRKFLWAPADFVLPPIETVYEGDEIFEYRLLPLDSRLPSFDRFNWPEATGTLSMQRKSTHHSYPYDSLPTLFSRAKPHFVICDSAPKLFHHINSVSSRLSSDVQSLWPLSELDASCMLRNVDYTYRAWLERAAPPHFASLPRHPLRAPSLGPKLPKARRLPPPTCIGPCFNSRFAWIPSSCSCCRGDVCHRDTSDSDSDGSIDSSEVGSEYRVHHSNLTGYVGAWQTCCSRQVKKRGRWTSQVANDEQLRGYAEERPRKIARTV